MTYVNWPMRLFAPRFLRISPGTGVHPAKPPISQGKCADCAQAPRGFARGAAYIFTQRNMRALRVCQH